MSFFPTPVLVGVDDTPAGHHAVVAAAQLCAATGSHMHLVHVKLTSGTLRGRPMTPPQRERADAEAQELLDREAAQAADHNAEVVGAHIRYGERPEVVFTKLQQELEAGLLVIGARNRGTLARSLIADEAASPSSTVGRARASVWVVR